MKFPGRRLFAEECGQNMMEYALIGGLIGIAAIAAIRNLSAILNALSAAMQLTGSSLWP